MENNNQIISQDKTHPLFFLGICFIIFLPIIVLPPTFQPSDWTRAILFRIILTILLSFLFFKFFYKKEVSFSIPKWKSRVYLPFLIFVAFFIILILATIFSEDIRFSVFGSPSRAGGILNLLFFFVFAVFLILFIKDRDWEKLWRLNFLVGFLASLLAIIQYFHLFSNLFVSYGGGGTPSFLGNSTFLAIYMLFLVFLSFTFLIREKNKKRKMLYGALFLLFSFTILITGSRATYLGVLIGFFYFFFFYPKKFKTLKIFAASFLVLAVSMVLIFNFFPQIAEKNNLLKVVVDRLSIKKVAKDLVGTRFAAWEITLQTIKEKPILGWGPENFNIGFEKYYDPTLPNMDKLWWDRPHNIFLDVWANSGVFSLLFYIAFWISLFWQLQNFKRKQGDNENTYLAHGVQAMFIGYLIALFFNFDAFATYFISFFFIGYSFYLISGQSERKIIYPPKTNIIKNKFVYIPLLLLLTCFIWFWNIRPLYLNEKINYAGNLINAKKCEKAIPAINSVWEKGGILETYAGLKYTDFIKQCASAHPEKEIDYATKASEALKRSAAIQPKFTRAWLFLGSFINVLAAREENNSENKNKLLLEARGYLERALKLSPKRQEIIMEMEKNYLLAEDYQTMKQLAEDCIKIDPSHGGCYWYLGLAEIFLGDQENGKKNIQESKEKNYRDPSSLQLGIAYISQKNYKDAADAYYWVVSSNPNNASYHATLAFLYREIGEYPSAAAEAIKVFKLQPENKEALEFLRQLLGLSPNDPSLHSSLAYVYTQTGEKEKARQEYLILKSFYSQAVANDPREPYYHYNLALVCKELQEYEMAYNEASIAASIDQGNLDLQAEVKGLIQSLPENYWEDYIKTNPRIR